MSRSTSEATTTTTDTSSSNCLLSPSDNGNAKRTRSKWDTTPIPITDGSSTTSSIDSPPPPLTQADRDTGTFGNVNDFTPNNSPARSRPESPKARSVKRRKVPAIDIPNRYVKPNVIKDATSSNNTLSRTLSNRSLMSVSSDEEEELKHRSAANVTYTPPSLSGPLQTSQRSPRPVVARLTVPGGSSRLGTQRAALLLTTKAQFKKPPSASFKPPAGNDDGAKGSRSEQPIPSRDKAAAEPQEPFTPPSPPSAKPTLPATPLNQTCSPLAT